MTTEAPKPTYGALRKVRSFMRREGRLTEGQERALTEFWPRFGIAPGSEILDLDAVFERNAPRIIEIGFGMGESLATMAARHPENDYLGIDVYRPGVGSLLRQVGENGSTNVRAISEDAVVVLAQMIPDNSLDRLQLFFPDPWHKRRHHKRRIVQPEFAALVRQKLKPGGVFHMATDWEAYAQHMMAVMIASQGYQNCAGQGQYAERPESRPLTKFEQRGHRLGHGVWDLLFERVD